MKFFKNTVFIIAAASMIVAAIILITVKNKPTLILSDADTGKVYATFAFDYDDTFSVSFIHSVNQSEVIDYFKRGDNNKIICFKNKFHSFGAGMPESWPDGVTIETTHDGIIVNNLDIVLDDVTYVVGTVSDHILTVNNKTISLSELCGKNSEVLFKLR